jgi:hypothetical protein
MPWIRSHLPQWILLWCFSIVLTVSMTLGIVHFIYSNQYISKDHLYEVSGLSELQESEVFQDFAPRSQDRNNVNVVSWLWADPYKKGSIQAFVIQEDTAKADSSYLRVLFDNVDTVREGFTSNFAIRPRQEKAVKVPSEHTILRFSARIPTSGEGIRKSSKKEKLILTIRVVDRHQTHWEYRQPQGHSIPCEVMPDRNWQFCQADLQDLSKWTLFVAGGNTKFAEKTPDFSILTAIVIVVGTQGNNDTFGGVGALDIADVRIVKPIGMPQNRT